jgi:hypothetical protein
MVNILFSLFPFFLSFSFFFCVFFVVFVRMFVFRIVGLLVFWSFGNDVLAQIGSLVRLVESFQSED